MPNRPHLPSRLIPLAAAALLLISCAAAPSSAQVTPMVPPPPTPIAASAYPAEATAQPAPAYPAEATAQPASAYPGLPAGGAAQAPAPPTYGYRVVNRYPHDTSAWTEGLVYVGDDTLYEGTGEYAASTLREVRLSTGEVLRSAALNDPPDASLYGEGIFPWNDTIFQLTWQNCVGLLYARDTFQKVGQFSYPQSNGQCAMEGWGLTSDGALLIMSDGTNTLSFIDPEATIQSGQLTIVRQVQVTDRGQPVVNLNELEYIGGAVFANVWLTDTIVRIDPASGEVTGWVDLRGLLSPSEDAAADVLNGIAYDAAGDRLFVTGKYWPALFEIKLDPPISYRLELPLIARG